MTLDPTDQRLIQELRENARIPVTVLARKLNLSRTAIQARIERLERDRIILGYTLRTGTEFERAHVQAHVMLTVAPKQSPAVEAALRKLTEVRTLLSVSGPFDMIVVVQAESIEKLDILIDRLGQLEGVERTHTLVVLSTRIQR